MFIKETVFEIKFIIYWLKRGLKWKRLFNFPFIINLFDLESDKITLHSYTAICWPGNLNHTVPAHEQRLVHSIVGWAALRNLSESYITSARDISLTQSKRAVWPELNNEWRESQERNRKWKSAEHIAAKHMLCCRIVANTITHRKPKDLIQVAVWYSFNQGNELSHPQMWRHSNPTIIALEFEILYPIC